MLFGRNLVLAALFSMFLFACANKPTQPPALTRCAPETLAVNIPQTPDDMRPILEKSMEDCGPRTGLLVRRMFSSDYSALFVFQPATEIWTEIYNGDFQSATWVKGYPAVTMGVDRKIVLITTGPQGFSETFNDSKYGSESRYRTSCPSWTNDLKFGRLRTTWWGDFSYHLGDKEKPISFTNNIQAFGASVSPSGKYVIIKASDYFWIWDVENGISWYNVGTNDHGYPNNANTAHWNASDQLIIGKADGHLWRANPLSTHWTQLTFDADVTDTYGIETDHGIYFSRMKKGEQTARVCLRKPDGQIVQYSNGQYRDIPYDWQ